MTSFLKKILSVIPDAQKKAIKALIEQKSKMLGINSPRFKSQEAAKISKNISSGLGSQIFQPSYAIEGAKLSSEDYNKDMEAIFVDLNSLYEAIASIANIDNQNLITLESDYIKSKSAVQKLLNDARVFSIRKQYPEFNEVKLIDFNSSRNSTAKNPKASINPKTRLLELPPIYQSRAHLENKLDKFTVVYTKTYTNGLYGLLNSEFTPNKIVDQRPETFWAQMVMADEAVSQKFELKNLSEVSQIDVYGPVVEVYFLFSHLEKINTIRLLPFSEFPVTILDIGYSSKDGAERFITIDNFTQENSLDWVEYNFNPIYAKEIRITLLQENYKSIDYSIPKSVLSSTTIFQEIFDRKTARLSSLPLDSDAYSLATIDTYQEAISSLKVLSDITNSDYTSLLPHDYLTKFNNILEEILSEYNIDTTEETVSISKYEYLIGLREAEINYEVYSPKGIYESEKFELNATPSEISIEVDQQNIYKDNHYTTSVEWEIDMGGGRVTPIHPRNITGDSSYPTVFDEKLDILPGSNLAYTRLGSYFSTPVNLKKNGKTLLDTEYSVSRITGAIPKLKYVLSGNIGTSDVYTTDYVVSPVSYSIDVLANYRSRSSFSPEIYTGTASNNAIKLTKFPYINYEIINSNNFEKPTGEFYWKYQPPIENVFSGQIRITPTITDNVGNILQTGSITGYAITGLWGDRSGEEPVNFGNILSSSYFGSISGYAYGYYLQIIDSPVYNEISAFDTTITGLTFFTPPEVTLEQINTWSSLATGEVFIGNQSSNPTGYLQAAYTIGVGIKTDGKVFTLGNNTYAPITVLVGDKEAKNITSYETLIHPAFSIANNRNTDIEYIQAGKNIYFNQPITQEISVKYSWISEYLKINGILKANTTPEATPKVDEIRLLINNMVI